MVEKWENIEGFDGKYQVSSFGRVRSVILRFNKRIDAGPRTDIKILKCSVTRGYKIANIRGLYFSNKMRSFPIHQLVIKAFKPTKVKGLHVNHIDANKFNNHIDNLEWVTPKENIQHALKLGLLPTGENHFNKKLNNLSVRVIRETYSSGMGNTVSIGKYFGVHRRTISDVINNKTWNHVN